MFDWADSNGLRAAGYLVVAALAFVAGRRRDDSAGAWPPFWLLTGGLLLAMGLGRIADIDGVMTSLFRDRAVESGWYDTRRPVQAVVVGGLGVAWLVVVLGSIWRIPERRRRYLPMIVIVVTLAAYAAIRMVSLHQVDSLLYRTHVGTTRVGTFIETVLLVTAGACTFWVPRGLPVTATQATADDPRLGTRPKVS